jgi:hypothetical protein
MQNVNLLAKEEYLRRSIMYKKLIYLVSVFMVVGLISPVAAQDVDMEIGFATQPPVLDGEVGRTHQCSISSLWMIRPMPPVAGRRCMILRISMFS